MSCRRQNFSFYLKDSPDLNLSSVPPLHIHVFILSLFSLPTHTQVAAYIPQLAKSNPDLWGVSLCTVDGQR